MTVSWNLIRIKADKAWQRGRGRNVRVAILDTGIDHKHPAMIENVRLCTNFTGETGDRLDKHGTHVAGIICASKGSEKVGVAPEADLYSLEVLDGSCEGTPSSIVSALEWCINHQIQIVNMSFGAAYDSPSVRQVVESAASSGILLVAAAGNKGFLSGNVLFPAAYDMVVAVTATNKSDQLSAVSSWGPEVDLCAPGQDIPSTDLYSNLPGWVMNSMPEGSFRLWPGDGWTSFAAPHVTGVMALVLSINSSITPAQARQILKSTAENLGLSPVQQGDGLVDADAATRMACDSLSEA